MPACSSAVSATIQPDDDDDDDDDDDGVCMFKQLKLVSVKVISLSFVSLIADIHCRDNPAARNGTELISTATLYL